MKEDHARNSESLALTPYIYPSLPQQVDYLRCKKCAVWHWYNNLQCSENCDGCPGIPVPRHTRKRAASRHSNNASVLYLSTYLPLFNHFVVFSAPSLLCRLS